MMNDKDSVKIYYSISEVCSMTGLEPHVLRYWESEFPQLRPKKNRAGNRAYRDKDIRTIRYIRFLLYDEKYTISGAKKKLAESKIPDEEVNTVQSGAVDTPAVPDDNQNEDGGLVRKLREELADILRILRE